MALLSAKECPSNRIDTVFDKEKVKFPPSVPSYLGCCWKGLPILRLGLSISNHQTKRVPNRNAQWLTFEFIADPVKLTTKISNTPRKGNARLIAKQDERLREESSFENTQTILCSTIGWRFSIV